MRRLALAGLLCGALNAVGAQPVQAAAAAAAPPLVSIERQGYAFEYPRVLAEQRLFGIAHGVSMLAESCRAVEPTAQASADAYARWYEQQQLQIEDLKNNLASFYYGSRAAEATWQHLVAALNLREKLSLAPDSEQLIAACASLPDALQQPRYDLTALFQLEAALAAMTLTARVDAQVAACNATLNGNEQTRLRAAHADWQQNEGAAMEMARAQLTYYWQATAAAGSPEEWLRSQTRRYSNPTALRCAGLADWLKSDQASLMQSFAPPPSPVALQEEKEIPDHAVSAVAHSTPQSTDLTETKNAATAEVQASSLLDTTMRMFDERPHEDAARKPGK